MSATAVIKRYFSEQNKEAISLKKNNTPDCAVMDYGFRLTRTSVSGIFDGILMEPATELQTVKSKLNYISHSMQYAGRTTASVSQKHRNGLRLFGASYTSSCYI